MRTDLNLRLVDLARFFIGIGEAGGANRGPMVEAFQKAVDGKAEGEPWCMGFVQYCIKETIRVHGGSTYMVPTESSLQAWEWSQPVMRIRGRPQVGDIAIWQHGGTRAGHTGIVTEVYDGGTMKTVEGNTSIGVGIDREGDGVYLRTRPWDDGVGNMKLVGFIRPFT